MSDEHLNHPGTPEDDPAMPHTFPSTDHRPPESHAGLSAREHAAIQLRLPDSGNQWLDEMIAKARVLDTATALLAAQVQTGAYSAGDAEDLAHELLDQVLTEPRLVEVPTRVLVKPETVGLAAAPEAQTFEFEGKRYKAAPDLSGTRAGCAFYGRECVTANDAAEAVLGFRCHTGQSVIYIEATK